MLNIKPLSDSTSYTQVVEGSPKQENIKTAHSLFIELRETEKSADKDGWIPDDDMKELLGLTL